MKVEIAMLTYENGNFTLNYENRDYKWKLLETAKYENRNC